MNQEIIEIEKRYNPQSLQESMDKLRRKRDVRYVDHITADTIPGKYVAVNPAPAPEDINLYLTYEIARLALYDQMTKVLHLERKRFMIDPKNAPKLTNIIKAVIGDMDGKYNPAKGIYLWGDNSRGKTWIMGQLFKMLAFAEQEGYGNAYDVRVINYKKDIMLRAREEGSIGFMKKLICDGKIKNIYVDDLGYDNDSQLILFGQKEDVLPELINLLYLQYIDGAMIHFTSNLDIKRIYHIYGSGPGTKGTGDRLMEMCTPVLWEGDYNFRTGKKEVA